ncbi:hypothetical protein JZU46_03045 [bacterium]|nr:hypothetical protein [bacterium]
MNTGIECPYCKKKKDSVMNRTFSLFSSSEKVVYFKSCQECFGALGDKLEQSYRDYCREICSGD